MSTPKRVAVITGTASGIGKALAESFLAKDYTVYGFDIKATEINDSNFTSMVGDITDPEKLKVSIDAIEKSSGRIDVLVNNAGMQLISPIEAFDYANWQKVINLNLNACFLLSQYCFQVMKKNNDPCSIVNIGSIHSFEASANKAAYVAAKHGLLGLTRSLAVEGAEFNIKANLVAPGFVKTPLVDQQIPKLAKEMNISEEAVINNVMLAKTVDKQFTTTDDVIRTVLFFAEFPSLALTGQSLLVSHGQNMI